MRSKLYSFSSIQCTDSIKRKANKIGFTIVAETLLKLEIFSAFSVLVLASADDNLLTCTGEMLLVSRWHTVQVWYAYEAVLESRVWDALELV